jgi:alanine racemase
MSGATDRAVAVVDLAAVRHNAALLVRTAGRARLAAVVKADAYGHGAVPVARAALEGGAGSLAVATAAEAEELRAAGIGGPVVVLGPLTGPEWARAAGAGGEVVCWDAAGLDAARAAGVPGVHLELDTGMGRLGARVEDAAALADAAAARGVRVAGVMTHFATADETEGPNAGFLREQLVRFRAALPALTARAPGALAHAANSAATLREPASHLDMVRCGIALYGCSPFGRDPADHGLRPVMSWRSYLGQVKQVRSRESVGYGRTHRAARGTWIGIVPVGYADGYARSLSNRAEALVGGRRVPVVGTVSMDLIALDLGPEATERAGDEVVLLGAQGGERILAEDLARRRATIAYEVTCAVGRRVRREPAG